MHIKWLLVHLQCCECIISIQFLGRFFPTKEKPHTQEAVTCLSLMCGPFASLADELRNRELEEMIAHQRFSLWGIYLIQNARMQKLPFRTAITKKKNTGNKKHW